MTKYHLPEQVQFFNKLWLEIISVECGRTHTLILTNFGVSFQHQTRLIERFDLETFFIDLWMWIKHIRTTWRRLRDAKPLPSICIITGK